MHGLESNPGSSLQTEEGLTSRCPRVGASLHSLHVPRALLGELHNLPFPLSLLPGHRSQPDYFSSLSPQFSVDLKAMVVEGSFCQFLSSFMGEGTTRRGTDTPVHRPEKPAGSTHSSTSGLSSQRSLATRGEDWASQGQPKGKAERRTLEVFLGGRRETLISLAFCRGP